MVVADFLSCLLEQGIVGGWAGGSWLSAGAIGSGHMWYGGGGGLVSAGEIRGPEGQIP